MRDEMQTKVKICGLRCKKDIDIANRCLPDYVGFVFAKSKRQVSRETAAELKKGLRPEILAVGVFVHAPIEEVVAVCQKHIIDVVQLHGEEDEAYMAQLRRQVTQPIVRAVRVQSTEQILQAQALPCDMLLLDTYTKGQYGGSGKTFDYNLIPELEKPYFLAGGLDEENVVQAIRKCRPYAVDISSRVETDGWKDEEKVAGFIRKVRMSGGEFTEDKR